MNYQIWIWESITNKTQEKILIPQTSADDPVAVMKTRRRASLALRQAGDLPAMIRDLCNRHGDFTDLEFFWHINHH